MSDALVSVILPTYSRNYDGLLQGAIESVLSQEHSSLELLIADDGSTDGSSDVIKGYVARDSRVRHIRFERNVGLPAYTTCVAFLQSKGDYIAWCFDDCRLYPQHLATLVAHLERHPLEMMVYGRTAMKAADGSTVPLGGPLDLELLRKAQNHIPNVTTMLRREVFESAGWYDPNIILKRCCDWDLWLRILARHDIGYVDDILAEEKGGVLWDSLGNNVSTDVDVVLKYVQNPRDHLLKPSLLKDYDPFSLRHVNNFTAQDVRFYERLLLAHFVKTENIEKVVGWGKEHSDPRVVSRIRIKNPDGDDRLWSLAACFYEHLHNREAELFEQIKTLRHLSDERLRLLEEITARLKPLVWLYRQGRSAGRAVKRLFGKRD